MLDYWLKKTDVLLDLAKDQGTPLYVYDLQVVKNKNEQLKKAFKDLPYEIHYASKANENPELLRFIKDLGLGIDAVSPNEIKRALSVGFSKDKIIYTPSCPDFEELDFAFQNNIHTHIGAVEYLDFILQNYPQTPVGLRINPGNSIGGNQKIATAHQDSKFGIPYTQMDKVKQYIQKGLQVDSLHIHTGSDVKTWQDLARSVDVIFELAREFKNLKYIDLGSGFKVKYHKDDPEIDLQAYADYIRKKLDAFPYPVSVKFEPGKFLVSEAGVFLTRVNMVKQGFQKKFAGVNSGFHHLIRPMYYGAYHEIVNLSNLNGPVEKYDVVGQLCEEDTFAYDRPVSQIRRGDILMFMNAGAYAYSMVSEYNLRDKPREIIL